MARPLRVLAVLLSLLALQPTWQLASAEDTDVAVEADGEDDAETPAQEGEGGHEAESREDAEARAASFAASAKELQDKLGQLKALLDKKGESADPALKERLQGLEQQLESLGLGLGGGSVGATKELHEFLAGCVSMSIRRAGVRRPSTLGALRKMANNKLTPTQAAETELFRMVGVCIAELTDAELGQFKAGKLTILPQAMVDKAAKPDAKELVTAMEAGVYKELPVVSGALLKQIGGEEDPLPIKQGLLAGLPLLAVLGFLGKKFFDMQKREGAKKEKKEKKEAKKAK